LTLFLLEGETRQLECSLMVLLATVCVTLKGYKIANTKCTVKNLDLPTHKCRVKWVMV